MALTAYTDYIDPALLVLIPVLIIIGKLIKSAASLDNRYIPLILGILGVALSVLWTLSSVIILSWQNFLMALFTAIIQGILCSGAAVYANQLVKQAGNT